MGNELRKHKIAYTILFLGLLLFVGCFFTAWPNHELQRLFILAVSVFYFLWGVVTHVKSDHISSAILLEYAGMATLAGVLLLLITW